MRTPVQAVEMNGRAAKRANGHGDTNGRDTTPLDVSAAVFRLERVLSPIPPELGAAWMASYSTSLRTRALRIGGAMLGVPARLVGANPTQNTRVTWMGLEGLSRDRIEILGKQFAEERIMPKLRTRPLALLEEARRRGNHLVLLSSSILRLRSTLQRHSRLTNSSVTDLSTAEATQKVPVRPDDLSTR